MGGCGLNFLFSEYFKKKKKQQMIRSKQKAQLSAVDIFSNYKSSRQSSKRHKACV